MTRSSPFDAALAGYGPQLPPVFHTQFLAPGEPSTPFKLVGHMDRIWHRPRWLWPAFWLLAQIDALFPETGLMVPASMTVTSYEDASGQYCQTWQRTFWLKPRRYFNATMLFDPRLGKVVELVGPSGILRVAWDISFHPPVTIEIRAAEIWVRLGPWHVRLPDRLRMHVEAVERADPSHNDAIHIQLTISQPPFGPIFGYEGSFHLCRTATEETLYA